MQVFGDFHDACPDGLSGRSFVLLLKIPADAPLIETPRAFLPPVDQWDDPKHYNPYRGQCPVGGQIPMGTGSKI